MGALVHLRQTDGWFMQEMIRKQFDKRNEERVCPRSN